MNATVKEILQFVKENDVKFIRLNFCDILGTQKNISIMADELETAFEHGVPFDAHAILGFNDITRSDLLLFPDPSTLAALPWRPGPGSVARFYCDIKNPDGTVFSKDSRGILKRVITAVQKSGYVCKVGAECEFFLFKTDDNGEPTDITFDKGGYLDMSPLDKCEDIRREICLTLEEMGIKPESSHHERAPGQNEISFRFSDALSCADNLQTFKSVVKAISARNGLFASFMPKPVHHFAGNGLHVNLSLSQNGLNVFKDGVSRSFIAGILGKTPEFTLFLNPIANSYERFGSFEAPKYVSWSHQNRSQLVRIPAAIGERVRMELRSPDPSVNPYIAFALIIAAGMEGVKKEINLPQSVDVDLYSVDKSVTENLAVLPNSLEKAIVNAQNSDFVKTVVGEVFLSKYIEIKQAEALEFAAAEDKAEFYRKKYFNII